MFESLATFLLIVFMVVGLYLAISAGVWWLWCTVLSYVWPTGPEQVINPSFWMFAAAFFLFGILFGGSRNGSK